MEYDTFIDCNSKTLEMFRCTREQIISKHPYDPDFSPEKQPDLVDSTEKSLEKIDTAWKGIPQFFEWKHRRYNAEPFDAEVSLDRLELDRGHLLLAIVRDITERKQAEEEIKQSEERYRFLAENMADIVWILDSDFRTTYVSPSITKVLGFTPEERKLQTVDEVVTPDSLQRTMAIYLEGLQRDEEQGADPERYVIFEAEYYHADGHTVWLENSMKTLRDETGAIVGMYGSSRDITLRKQAEDALKESAETFRSLAEQSPNMIFINRKGRVIYANERCAEIMGYSREELCSPDFDFLTLIAPESLDTIKESFNKHMKGEDVPPYDYTLITRDGERIEAMIATKLISYQGEISILGILTVITERKQAEQQSRIQRDLAQSLNSIVDLEEAAMLCIQTAIDSADMDSGGVYVVDPESGDLDMVYSMGLSPGFISSASHFDGNSPNAKLVMAGKPIYSQYVELEINIDDIRAREGLQAIAVIPIIHENNVIGDLNIASHTMPEIPVLTRHMLESIAAQMGGTMARLRASAALQESEEKYRNVVERANDVIIIVQDGVVKYANPLATEMTGYTPEEAIGRPLSDFVHPDEVQTTVDRYTRRMAGEDMPPIYETALLHKDGRRIEIELSGGVISYLGRPADLIIIRNITERKQAEKEIRESEKRFRTIFESANDAIIYVDANGIILDANDKLGDIFGFMREEAIGKNFAEFAFLEQAEMKQIVDLFTKSLATEGPALIELEVKHKDGHTVFAEASTTTIEDDTGVRGALTILRDITERKQAEAEAARARALEELDQLRTALLASVSHELRTPLTSIKGLASTLVQPDVEWDAETQMDFLKSIVQESDRLNHIVSDLLEMSRLEAGMMRIEKTETQISAIVKQVGDELRNITQKHRFEINVPPDMPRIYADEIRIGEVITNLVSNAASYSEEGTQIAIDASQSNGEIVVSVIDEGIGIPPEHQDKVFDRFYRLESGVSRRRGGSGLGLAICKGIIEEHGGQISVESNLGEGSKFSFSLAIVKRIETDHDSSIPSELRES